MSFINEVFSQNANCNYMALYGWQYRISGEALVQYGYIAGYKSAADYLVDIAVQNGQQDMLIFPIMFNYRQYIELVLKYILRQLQSENDYVNTIQNYSHNIKGLLNLILNLLKINLAQSNVDIIVGVVDFFDKYDPHSFNYRFPLDKKGKESIKIEKDKEQRINLQVLKIGIDKFDDYFYQFYGI